VVDFVSELQPPTGLLFILQIIYELGEHYRQGRTPDSSTRAFWQSYQQSNPVAKQEELDEGNDEFGLAKQPIFVHTSKEFLICRMILRHGADGFTSVPKGSVLRIFIALKNPSSSAGFEPANLGSNGMHANNYTTEDDFMELNFSLHPS
jgi:hypothetical protein